MERTVDKCFLSEMVFYEEQQFEQERATYCIRLQPVVAMRSDCLRCVIECKLAFWQIDRQIFTQN